ncbi:hypothetical protein ElyMa_001693200 [Elysia marginata]|uniref:Uncharacterized protein n=1 Tax=Elysia marginata TaxID=1093978 RepID=A0AAV4JVB6_9GAST|nr:hypothetical protein ElyMa_001693200 [Elysia marginata]
MDVINIPGCGATVVLLSPASHDCFSYGISSHTVQRFMPQQSAEKLRLRDLLELAMLTQRGPKDGAVAKRPKQLCKTNLTVVDPSLRLILRISGTRNKKIAERRRKMAYSGLRCTPVVKSIKNKQNKVIRDTWATHAAGAHWQAKRLELRATPLLVYLPSTSTT